MNRSGIFLFASTAGLVLSSCGAGGSAGGALSVVSCSLGCSSAASNGQFSCAVTDVYVNQEIRVSFSRPVDLASVNNNSFQVVEATTGKTPPGSFTLDPLDDSVVIYRPRLTFDSAGNPVFGLTPDETYNVYLPGTRLDPGLQHIQSSTGQENVTRMFCVIEASLGVFDVNPGPPRVTVTVDLADPTSYDSDNFPQNIIQDQPAQGAENVFRNSDICMVFDDVMNPATLANPVTGESNFISVAIDTDGDVSNVSDQVSLPGVFTLIIDQEALSTTLIFRPDGGFPSAGTDPRSLRRIVLRLPSTITDLGGNPLANAGQIVFTPEAIPFDLIEVLEDFSDTTNEDGQHSGSLWASAGQLLVGTGGGSGRLGDLLVPSGEVITLSTDSEDFSDPIFADTSIFNPENVIEGAPGDPTLPVVGGVFEFARLRIEPGGTLVFSGSNPTRIFVRGQAFIEGSIDVAGASAISQDDTQFDGGPGAAAGPGGGEGGDGGDLPDGFGFGSVGGVDNPNNPALYDDINGADGGGIPFPNKGAPTDSVAFGSGGLAWPQPTVDYPSFHFPADPTDVLGMQYEPGFLCRNRTPGGAGGGGGYALSGKDGVASLVNVANPIDETIPPPDSPGGDADELAIDDAVRSLDPDQGLLRGGSGGGGGAGHLQETSDNGTLFIPDGCTMPSSGSLVINFYSQHSSAGGGGGAGGLQVQAGRNMQLEGFIDASGGDGGGRTGTNRAQAGGGGSGGAVLLQSQAVTIQSVPGRINIEGGNGGSGANGSTGGDGSPGLLRIETVPPVPDVGDESSKIRPDAATLASEFGATIQDIFSTAQWQPGIEQPGSFTGSQACWIRPDGNFFQLTFASDGAELGWDMLVKIAGVDEPQSYRGSNDIFGSSLESVFGSELGAAPIVVRFQGARTLGTLVNPCDVPLVGIESPLLQTSLSEWVSHPESLNSIPSGITPNLVRFVILFDRSQPFGDMIEAIEEITIRVQPD